MTSSPWHRRQPIPQQHDAAVCGLCHATMRRPDQLYAMCGAIDHPDNISVAEFARVTKRVRCPLCIFVGWFAGYARRELAKGPIR